MALCGDMSRCVALCSDTWRSVVMRRPPNPPQSAPYRRVPCKVNQTSVLARVEPMDAQRRSTRLWYRKSEWRYGAMWCYVAIHGDVWRCVALCGDASRFEALYKAVGSLIENGDMAIRGAMWRYVAMPRAVCPLCVYHPPSLGLRINQGPAGDHWRPCTPSGPAAAYLEPRICRSRAVHPVSFETGATRRVALTLLSLDRVSRSSLLVSPTRASG